MKITIDEWIVYYLLDKNKLNEIFNFLERVKRKCDMFVCMIGSPLGKKIWQLSKVSNSWSQGHKDVIKYFFYAFVNDIVKFEWLDENELSPVSDSIKQIITDKDDEYILRTALSTIDKLILTTDKKHLVNESVKKQLGEIAGIKVEKIEEFIKTYETKNNV